MASASSILILVKADKSHDDITIKDEEVFDLSKCVDTLRIVLGTSTD
jgi:hypothetical protein